MPTPFPGMDPYLEDPDFWPGVHHRLITAIGDDLAARLARRYYVDVEERTVVALPQGGSSHRRPDVAVVALPCAKRWPRTPRWAPSPSRCRRWCAWAICKCARQVDHQVVTVIEVLSPFNKRQGPGRADYEAKRMSVLARSVHLIEIDLLRSGEPMPLGGAVPRSAYRLLVSRWDCRPAADLYPFNVTQPIPVIPVPLLPGDEPVALDVGSLLHDIYDRGRYDLRIDYRQEPTPPLAGDAAGWADHLLQTAGQR